MKCSGMSMEYKPVVLLPFPLAVVVTLGFSEGVGSVASWAVDRFIVCFVGIPAVVPFGVCMVGLALVSFVALDACSGCLDVLDVWKELADVGNEEGFGEVTIEVKAEVGPLPSEVVATLVADKVERIVVFLFDIVTMVYFAGTVDEDNGMTLGDVVVSV